MCDGAGVQGPQRALAAGCMTFGEGWHNNHHAFPGSARLGLYPGQTDPRLVGAVRRCSAWAGSCATQPCRERCRPRGELRALARESARDVAVT